MEFIWSGERRSPGNINEEKDGPYEKGIYRRPDPGIQVRSERTLQYPYPNGSSG